MPFLTPKCLAVDDDPLSLKLAQAACLKLKIDFKAVSDVNAMIDVLRTDMFDLILLDNDIAGVRGHQVLDYAKSDISGTTKIIVYSSSVNAADKFAYEPFKVVEFLQKPLSVDANTFAVRKALQL